METKNRVCPWWMGYFLASPVRAWFENPLKFLGPYVKEGMTVLDAGCGMGFWSLSLAELVGPKGRVVCVDVQEKMLQGLRKRATRAGMARWIDAKLSDGKSLKAEEYVGRVDFALAAYVVHEAPDVSAFLSEIQRLLKPKARLQIVEPKLHVSRDEFEETVLAAKKVGFSVFTRLETRFAHRILLEKA